MAPRTRLCVGSASRTFHLSLFTFHVFVLIPVMVPNPSHGERQAIFVPAFWYEIEIIVGADQKFRAAGVGRIGVENRPGTILGENADTRCFFAWEVAGSIVVKLAFSDFLSGKRDAVVVVELVCQ